MIVFSHEHFYHLTLFIIYHISPLSSTNYAKLVQFICSNTKNPFYQKIKRVQTPISRFYNYMIKSVMKWWVGGGMEHIFPKSFIICNGFQILSCNPPIGWSTSLISLNWRILISFSFLHLISSVLTSNDIVLGEFHYSSLSIIHYHDFLQLEISIFQLVVAVLLSFALLHLLILERLFTYKFLSILFYSI